MKKRFSAITLVVILIFSFTLAVPVSAQQVTAITNGFTNVEFSNGYFGYCIDRDLHGAYTNDVFNTSDTSIAKSNVDNSDISQYLKILFTQHFSELFVSDGNGGYVLDSNKKDSIIPQAIYNLSDGQYIWGESKTLINSTKAYTGPAIPDEGYTKTLDNGDIITFYFMALEPEKNDQQTFFAYKIAVNEQPTHVHDFHTEWTGDDDNHWHECDCGEKKDVEAHSGNEPDCIHPSICDDCGKELEGVDSNNHSDEYDIRNAEPVTEFKDGYTGDKHCKDCGALIEKGTVIPATHVHDFDETIWESDDDEHWHECSCGEKKDVEAHSGNFPDCITPSICNECAKQFEGVNPDNHISEPEIRNDKPAKEFEEGYTGDKYCPDCDTLLEEGEVIPATHQHKFHTEWTSDDDNHWHECDCGEKEDVESHSFNENKCICGKEIKDNGQKPNDNTNTNGNGNNNVEQDEIPNTSVVSNIGPFFVLLLLSTMGLAFITYRKKEHGII